MNKNANNTNGSQATVIASSIGGAAASGGLATVGASAAFAVVAAPIATPIAIAFGVGYVVLEAWSWL